jgi:DNA repair exonuclease SbcCD ATPase subunit
MKILALQAENLKRLVAVEIRPDGNLVEITGKNGQGKTSVLDAIWWALEGASHIQAVPIRRGATEAIIRLDLGELKVTRKFKAKEDGGFTTSIAVENADGAKYGSPQAMLDALVGELAFDPLAFTRLKPSDKLETLKRFVPGVDFEGIERANKAEFDERTAINRRAKEIKAQAEGVVVPAGAPAELIDDAALIKSLEKAGEFNADIERRRAARANAEAQASQHETNAEQIRERAQRMRAEADDLDLKSREEAEKATQLRKRISDAAPLPAPVDTAKITLEIQSAKTVNAAFEAAKRKAELLDQASALEQKSKALTASISARDAAKEHAIKEAKMPIDDVSFGDGVVLLAGVPFEQASDAEQLRASISIAAAMNPKLRVIRVRDGSLLDSDAMEQLAKFADAQDMQIWIERVDSSGAVGFVLEDGHSRKSAQEAA